MPSQLKISKRIQEYAARKEAASSGKGRVYTKQDKYLAQAWSGAEGLVDRVERFGANEKGARIRLENWNRELLLLYGDLRISEAWLTGCAQLGKTLSAYSVMIDWICYGGFNVGWSYSTLNDLYQMVPMQFTPMIEDWIANMESAGIPVSGDKDHANNRTRYQVGGATAIFTYVSTSKPNTQGGKAAAGGSVVSFQADAMFMEERSQYPAGAAAPLARRLDQSGIPTRPIRELGTPGGGQWIQL